jgi:hypothetical protein
MHVTTGMRCSLSGKTSRSGSLVYLNELFSGKFPVGSIVASRDQLAGQNRGRPGGLPERPAARTSKSSSRIPGASQAGAGGPVGYAKRLLLPPPQSRCESRPSSASARSRASRASDQDTRDDMNGGATGETVEGRSARGDRAGRDDYDTGEIRSMRLRAAPSRARMVMAAIT